MIQAAIIEDDPIILKTLCDMIDNSNDITLIGTANNYLAGQALIASGGYDVLLCDLGLPDGSGIELIRASCLSNPTADIIVITMFADHKKVINSLKAGAKGYLLKDENLDDCVAAIREIRRGGSPINPIIARQLLNRFQPPSPNAIATELSDQESKVLGLLARGYSYVEIADLLNISAQTVGTYIKRLYRKLQVSSRSEAVFEASSRGMLDES